ncbi:spore germination protein [Hathewaya massiliensis]|uniref:spore germination protein n=1 Tax=Hathewaya massiliensis TaxID=1964382 RepID=UPI00115B7BBA|nr:spore germination protein [Hathewaya massiliensis]
MNIDILTNNFNENLELIKAYSSNNDSLREREILLKGNLQVKILFIGGIANQDYIEQTIIYPLLFKVKEDLTTISDLPNYLIKKYISSYDISLENSLKTISLELNRGKTIILLPNCSEVIICSTSGQLHRSIQSSDTELSILGGKDAFIENLDMNLTLVNQKMSNNNFTVEKFVLGRDTNTDVALLYIDGIIDKKILNSLREKLKTIDAPYIGGVGYIAEYIFNEKFKLFPLCKMTELPDKVITDMLQGKAAIMVNGFPHALVVPSTFLEFFQTFEDYTNNSILGSFDRLLRILAALVLITLSPLYVALLEYNVELLPMPLIKVLIISRSGIPFSPFVEVLIMEILIEMLREGGIRLPKPIGQTLGIVGGIILGDAATRAGIVSQTTLVVISIGVICTFLIPNYVMSTSIRLFRFPMIILAKLLGLLGIISGLFVFFITLMTKESLSIPYLSPLSPVKLDGLKDSLIRANIKKINRTPTIFSKLKRSKNS